MSTIAPVSPVGPTPTDGPTTSIDNPGAMLDRDAFLKLLVAQLKYQDPTKPADATAMVAQSAQLTMVDRLNDINNQLTSSAASQRIALASSIVGKEVSFVDADGMSRSAVVQSARFDGGETILTAGSYTVPLAAVNGLRSPAETAAAGAPTGTPASSTPAGAA